MTQINESVNVTINAADSRNSFLQVLYALQCMLGKNANAHSTSPIVYYIPDCLATNKPVYIGGLHEFNAFLKEKHNFEGDPRKCKS